MLNANFPLKNAALLCVALLLFVSVASAIDFTPNATITACDNFGKTWSITPAACSPALPLTLCLSGARDTQNLLGCGPLPLYGSSYVLLLGVFNATAYSESTNCVDSTWLGSGLTTITGNVFNQGGLFGSFTLTAGACATTAAVTAKDPSRR
ncbi:MAG TPA: hypothetical protein VKV17_02975 [Bryobacteraceae bacterium]|nr:hypothetical protein [Bryobacteraceae bacterium]